MQMKVMILREYQRIKSLPETVELNQKPTNNFHLVRKLVEKLRKE